MQIAALLYDDYTALDIVGPYEILSRLPETTFTFVAKGAGEMRSDTGALALVADRSLSDLAEPDVVVVPGGPGSSAAAQDPEIQAWVRKAAGSARYVASVCTGAEVLAAAGLLDGLEATTHWGARDTLAALGAVPVERRVVLHEKVGTAAGVSAGIDMALALTARLVSEDFAKALQLGIEYDPEPPFDAGSPDKVSPEVVALVRATLGGGAAAG